MIAPNKPLFSLGSGVTYTPAAIEIMLRLVIQARVFLNRHIHGDFGDCNKEDWAANELAIAEGHRIFSVYNFGEDTLWVITEADRSSTCVLTPNDY